MKIFRLARAELNKLFQRPAIFLMAGFLVVALVLVSFFYNPTLRTDTRISYQGANTTEIHTQFQAEKTNIIAELSSLVDEINTETYNINNNSSRLDELKNLIANAEGALEDFHSELLKDSKNINNMRSKLEVYKTRVLNIQTFLSTIETNIDFFITTGQLNTLKAFFERLNNDIPSNTTNYTVDNMVELGNFLVLNRNFSDHVYPTLNALKEITLDVTEVNRLVEQYYNNIAVGENSRLSLYENQIEEYYLAHIGSSEEEDMQELNDMFSNYKSIVLMAKECLDNSFTLLKVNDISNATLSSYVGFSDLNKYTLENRLQKTLIF